jgi:hypothetical protein
MLKMKLLTQTNYGQYKIFAKNHCNNQLHGNQLKIKKLELTQQD